MDPKQSTTGIRKSGSSKSDREDKETQESGVTTYSYEEQYFARFLLFFEDVVENVFHYVFEKGLADRLPHEPLWDFYTRNGIDIKGLKTKLTDSQCQKIDADPSGSSFDITLIYLCLRYGYHKLSYRKDKSWSKIDGCTIESLLTQVRNKKSHLAQTQTSLFTIHQLAEQMEDLQNKVIKILEFCRSLYGLPDATVDKAITKIKKSVKSHLINDINPKRFEEIKKSLVVEAPADIMKTDGWQEIQLYFQKGSEHQINTVNHVAKVGPISLQSVYVEMVMETVEQQENQLISFKDILQVVDEEGNIEKTQSVVIINGLAGTGKTILTKKLTLDWMNKRSEMKFLAEHDFIVRVECRSKTASSLEELIKVLMTNTSKTFEDDDLKEIILGMNFMVIIDGIDELNPKSTELFKEILHLKKSFGFTLLITTRPGKLQYLKNELESHSIESKTIQLLGVPQSKIGEFCNKYYKLMRMSNRGAPDVSLLLDYLLETHNSFSDLWTLPYNLTLVTTLFVHKNGEIAKPKLFSRLYREIYNLYETKVVERYQISEAPDLICDTTVIRKINHFMYVLTKESLISLREGCTNLSQESCKELEEVCVYNHVELSDMADGFPYFVSDSSPSTSAISYCFPHKGLQDYLAALYVWYELVKEDFDYKEEILLKKIVHECQRHDSPPDMIEVILGAAKALRQEKASAASIEKVLASVEISCTSDISKYQGLLLSLVGIFFLEGDRVRDDHRRDIVKLLQKTGIKDKGDWSRVFKTVECDSLVTSLINEECSMLESN